MTRTERTLAYEVAFGPAACRVVTDMPLRSRRELIDALLTELADGPNAHNEIRFGSSIWADAVPGPDDEVYTATPLSFDGYTAIHRQMESAEINKVGEQEGRLPASQGFYVVDILSAESAFRPWLRLI